MLLQCRSNTVPSLDPETIDVHVGLWMLNVRVSCLVCGILYVEGIAALKTTYYKYSVPFSMPVLRVTDPYCRF